MLYFQSTTSLHFVFVVMTIHCLYQIVIEILNYLHSWYFLIYYPHGNIKISGVCLLAVLSILSDWCIA